MHLSQIVPSADILLAMQPDELGMQILCVVASEQYADIAYFLSATQSNRTAYPPERWAEIDEAIREAWAWLEGAAFLLTKPGQTGSTRQRVLSRRARQIVRYGDPRRALGARNLPKDAVHRAIREDVWSFFQRGEYDMAAFRAMKAVEVAVRDAAALPDGLVGVKLMRTAFAPEKDGKVGPLTDVQAEAGEQDGCANLFAGAMGLLKNPHSHRDVTLNDPSEAAEIIMIATHLLRIVQTRAAARA